MKLQYLKEYVILVENLNFTKTANQLFITQPALSRHIVIIEEVIGAKLLIRDKQKVSVTPSGQIIYELSKNILKNLDIAIEEVSRLSSGQIGSLKIYSPYYWTEEFMEPILLKFRENYPNIDVNLVSCQPQSGYHALLNRQSDISLLMREPDFKSEDVRFYDFALEKLAVVMSARHPLAERASVKLEEIASETMIFTSGKGFMELVLDLLATRNIKPETMVFTQQVDTIGLAIKETGGVSIMPYNVRRMNRDYIRVIPLEEEDCVLTMTLAYRVDNYNPCIPLFLKTAE